MTSPTPYVQPDLGLLAARAAELARLLAAAERDTVPVPGTPAEQAFSRLLQGSNSAEDVLQTGVAIAGARVLVATDADPRVLGQGRWVVRPQGPGLVALVAGGFFGPAASAVGRAGARLLRAQPVRAGVSSPIDCANQLPHALAEAQESASLGAPGELVFADVRWADLAVARLRSRLHDCLPLHHPLHRLDGDHLETVRTWCRLDGDIRATADALYLHVNTVRYRLRRSQELTGLDLGDASSRLVTTLLLGG
jgi:DNA-binding PucR family transcriptional regulator